MYLRNYGLWKTLLDICVKSSFLEDRLTGDMLNRHKHCCNLKDSTVAIFSDYFESK